MGSIPLGLIFYACLSQIWLIIRKRTIKSILLTISWIFLTPLLILYALSRIYIVVESFISLRHVPIGVYAAIPWVQDIPHI